VSWISPSDSRTPTLTAHCSSQNMVSSSTQRLGARLVMALTAYFLGKWLLWDSKVSDADAPEVQ
jgi:hypothetical protein